MKMGASAFVLKIVAIFGCDRSVTRIRGLRTRIRGLRNNWYLLTWGSRPRLYAGACSAG
jgi:hypothetical protein